TTLYRKPTDRYTYLHSSSFHPEHTTKSIVYSQALRYNHICSDPQDRDAKLGDLQNAFLRLQYPPCMINEQINKARRIPRDNLLQDRSKGPNDRTPLVVTYSPQVKPLTRMVNYLQTILDKNTTLSKALGGRPDQDFRHDQAYRLLLSTLPCSQALQVLAKSQEQRAAPCGQDGDNGLQVSCGAPDLKEPRGQRG
ncbi:hypothetical protein JRQ81_019911, partial [Phrynocephalus forsythii]